MVLFSVVSVWGVACRAVLFSARLPWIFLLMVLASLTRLSVARDASNALTMRVQSLRSGRKAACLALVASMKVFLAMIRLCRFATALACVAVRAVMVMADLTGL